MHIKVCLDHSFLLPTVLAVPDAASSLAFNEPEEESMLGNSFEQVGRGSECKVELFCLQQDRGDCGYT